MSGNMHARMEEGDGGGGHEVCAGPPGKSASLLTSLTDGHGYYGPDPWLGGE